MCYAVLAGALATLVLVLVGLTPGAGVASSEERVTSDVVVVQPGESLWSVAVRHAPDEDPVLTIEEIRRLNGLSGYTVHPGQTLRVP